MEYYCNCLEYSCFQKIALRRRRFYRRPIQTSNIVMFDPRIHFIRIADESMTKQICTITQKYKVWDICFYLCHILHSACLFLCVGVLLNFVQLGLVKSCLVCGEHIAGNVGVELQPDFVALVVNVPGCVQGTVPSLIRQNIFWARQFRLLFLCWSRCKLYIWQRYYDFSIAFLAPTGAQGVKMSCVRPSGTILK